MNILIFGSYGEIGASDFSGVKNFGGYGSKNGGGGSILEIGATGFSVGGVKISGCYDLKTGGGEAVLEICVTDFSGVKNFGGYGLKNGGGEAVLEIGETDFSDGGGFDFADKIHLA